MNAAALPSPDPAGPRAWQYPDVASERLIHVDLTDDEHRLLRAGLLDWGGPASPTDELAVAMGFVDARTLSRDAWALWKRIEKRDALAPSDWRRVLFALEVVIASDVVGSGLDWPTTSGISDEESIRLLRGLQRKLPRWRGSVQFRTTDAGSVETLDPRRTKL